MNTRTDLYMHEAGTLLDTLATYHTLQTDQLYQLFPPSKTKTVKMLIHRFIREKRLYVSEDEKLISAAPDVAVNSSLIKAFWVLLDFLRNAEFHTTGAFPVLINFFSDGELYEIIHVPPDQEAMISVALSQAQNDSSKRILIVDELRQKPQIHLDNIAGFCIVKQNGEVEYYK